MGLQVGDIIYCNHAAATAIIAGRRVIEFQGEIISLTEATKRTAPDAPKGNAFCQWSYGGETLWKIYDRAYPR